MALRLNPAAIANAIPYNNTLNAQNLQTCNPQPANGLKGVNIQVGFATAPGMIINMGSGGNANPPLEQTCALWVDNTGSTHDINIIVPDSGQQIRVGFGAQKLCPIFTSLKYPIFYVMLDDNGQSNPTDQTNIIALNQYIPFYDSEDFNSVETFGVGDGGELVPAFAQSNGFPVFWKPGIGGNSLFNIFPNGIQFVTSVDLTFAGSLDITNAALFGTEQIYGIQLFTNSASAYVYNGAFSVSVEMAAKKIVSISGLQLQINSLTAEIYPIGGAPSTFAMSGDAMILGVIGGGQIS